jgi:transporter family protein
VPAWLLLGFATVLLWGFCLFFGKLATNYISGSNTKIYLFLGNCVATGYAFQQSGFHLGTDHRAEATALFAGLLLAFANLFLFISLRRGGRASIILPLSNLYPFVTFLLAYVILKERVTAAQAAGIACAVGSILLLK